MARHERSECPIPPHSSPEGAPQHLAPNSPQLSQGRGRFVAFLATTFGLATPAIAQAGDFAMVGTGYGGSSTGLSQVDLDTSTRTEIPTSWGTYTGVADCEFIPSQDEIICSYINGSGNDGILTNLDPRGTPSSSTLSSETDPSWEWAYKINYDQSTDVTTFASTDFGTMNYAWVCDDSSNITPSTCDQYILDGLGPIGAAADTTDPVDPYMVVPFNSDGTFAIVRLSDGEVMYSGYAAPSHITPALTYPYDVALDPDTDVAYIASDLTITVVEIDPSDLANPTVAELSSTSPEAPTDAPYDLLLFENPRSGNSELWVAEGSSYSSYIDIYYAGDTTTTSLITTIPIIYSGVYAPLALGDAEGNSIYVSDRSSIGTASISKIDTSTYASVDTWYGGPSTGPLAIAWEIDPSTVDDDSDGIPADVDCDDGNPSVGGPSTSYADADLDGYGDPEVSRAECTLPSGYVVDATDCDDTNALINPDADEDCDDASDLNCDGDNTAGATDTDTFYRDRDGDGYGNAGSSVLACEVSTGTVTDATDCDDTDAAIHPGATETCDGVDEDCDGSIDEDAIDPSTYYHDGDGDGYGDPGDSVDACTPPSGYVIDNNDFNDRSAVAYPGASEIYSGNDLIDNDGNGVADCPLDGVTAWTSCDTTPLGTNGNHIEAGASGFATTYDSETGDLEVINVPGYETADLIVHRVDGAEAVREAYGGITAGMSDCAGETQWDYSDSYTGVVEEFTVTAIEDRVSITIEGITISVYLYAGADETEHESATFTNEGALIESTSEEFEAAYEEEISTDDTGDTGDTGSIDTDDSGDTGDSDTNLPDDTATETGKNPDSADTSDTQNPDTDEPDCDGCDTSKSPSGLILSLSAIGLALLRRRARVLATTLGLSNR